MQFALISKLKKKKKKKKKKTNKPPSNLSLAADRRTRSAATAHLPSSPPK
ncbi:hypothetical protein HanHA89_Chr05g0206651 [Helianthus annuus]|nr:hypothetical protein HanHA89_Chr05g0206651 [Helianthus annuus]